MRLRPYLFLLVLADSADAVAADGVEDLGHGRDKSATRFAELRRENKRLWRNCDKKIGPLVPQTVDE
jgi:hypothetical protein